jgi:hypothetical protein
MTPALPSAARERLVKLCGLLTSDHDGERATAARMATDLLRQHRLTWRELLTTQGPCPTCAAREAAEQERHGWTGEDEDWTRGPWRTVVRRCSLHNDLLTEWEVGFLASLQRRRWPPTPRQQDVLDRIADRVWGAGR